MHHTYLRFRLPLTLATVAALAGCGDDSGQGTDDGASDSGSGADTSAGPGGNPTTNADATNGETTADTTAADTTAADTTAGNETGPSGDAQVRVIHASAGAPNVDIYVEGVDTPIITDLAYGETSDYLTVAAGDYNVQVRAAGAPATDPPVYETGTLTLAADASVTAIAAGVLGSDDDAAAFRVLALADGFEDPGAGNAAVRVVHAGADAPTVDIDVGNDGSIELPGVARFADSGEAGVPLPADTALQVGIVAGGATVTAFTTPALPEGAQLYVIATGLLADLPRQATGFSLLAVVPTGSVGFVQQNPFVYALHASVDAGEVDVCVGDSYLLTGVNYADLGRVQVPPGAYDLEFHGAPSDCTGDPVFVATTPDLAAGQQYLAIAAGEVSPDNGDPSFTVLATAEAFDLAAAPSASAQIIHAASAPTVDIGLVEGGEITTPLATEVAFGEIVDPLVVPAATYAVGVAPAGSTTAIATFDLTLPASARLFAIAAGEIQPGSEEDFAIWAVDTATNPWGLAAIAPE